MARSRRPMSSLVSMSSAAAHLVAGEHRRLAARDDVLGAAHGPGWGRQQDASRHQVVEQLAYCGQVLLDARLSNFGAQLLDICGNRDGLDIIQLEVMIPHTSRRIVLPRARTPSCCGCGLPFA